MDSSRFDALTKIFTTRQPRRAAFPVLAALGLGFVNAQTDAAKKKGEKKVRVCNCASADVATCTSQKKVKVKVKKLLRTNPCAYRGRCTGVSGCTITVPAPPPGGSPPPPDACPAGQKPCRGGCLSILQCCDDTNCGALEPRCCFGTCIPRSQCCAVCGPSERCCNDACISLGGCCPGQACGASGTCVCHPVTGGGSVCTVGTGICADECTTNSDCPATQRCVVVTDCPGGTTTICKESCA
jgi:hypothetical protein